MKLEHGRYTPERLSPTVVLDLKSPSEPCTSQLHQHKSPLCLKGFAQSYQLQCHLLFPIMLFPWLSCGLRRSVSTIAELSMMPSHCPALRHWPKLPVATPQFGHLATEMIRRFPDVTAGRGNEHASLRHHSHARELPSVVEPRSPATHVPQHSCEESSLPARTGRDEPARPLVDTIMESLHRRCPHDDDEPYVKALQSRDPGCGSSANPRLWRSCFSLQSSDGSQAFLFLGGAALGIRPVDHLDPCMTQAPEMILTADDINHLATRHNDVRMRTPARMAV